MDTAVDMLDVICRRIKAYTAATLCWTILKLLGTVSVLSKYYHTHIRACGTFWPNLITVMWKISFQNTTYRGIWVSYPSVLNFSAPRCHHLQKKNPSIKKETELIIINLKKPKNVQKIKKSKGYIAQYYAECSRFCQGNR